MDAAANILQPYKEIIGHVTKIMTVARMLSGSLICWDIYKQGSTRGIGIMPFLLGLALSILNFKYGSIIRDNPVIQVGMMGAVLNAIYCLFYFYYTQRKVKICAQFGMMGSLTVALIGYAQIEDPGLVQKRFGLLITVFFLTLIASPLLQLKNVINNQTTEGLPFPFILSGATITFTWLIYGVILRNEVIVIQNTIAFLLSLLQLSLFAIYPSKHRRKHRNSVRKKTN
ncbi:unnamed protein product [Arctia plantaginis]|uniref:Sugar transporter SWEET n=1 Tax=Arctia plantaginis TaxID=874455 RepID=A0A8S1AZE2_ARCPL|nr:unnamed protein product [Arctia plantaginis]